MKTNNYNFVSPFYDLIAKCVFLNSIQKAQNKFIPTIPDKSTILYIGGGSGKSINLILKNKPGIHITFIDTSSKMLEKAKKNCNSQNQVEFILGDESAIPNKKFDVIITFFFLDLFSLLNQDLVFKKLNSFLHTNGIWLLADFIKAENWWQNVIESIMFTFLKLSTNIESSSVNQIEAHFKKSRFYLENRSRFYGGYIFSSKFRKL